MNDSLQLPTVVVASRKGAEALLVARSFDAVVSIRDPGSPRLVGLRDTPVLELEYDDVLAPSPDCDAPTKEHVQEVVRFGGPLRERTDTVLVHCEKGQSRSAATAITLFALWLGPGHELRAVRCGFAVLKRRWASPLLIDLADAVLGRDGALSAAFGEALSKR